MIAKHFQSSTTVTHLCIGRSLKTPHTRMCYMWERTSMPDTRQTERCAQQKLLSCCIRQLAVSRRHNSNRTAVTRIHRTLYSKMYPTMLVQPDGSTVTVRHKEPIRLIKLPVDLTKLSPEERQARLQQRKPKSKIIIEEEFEDTFDPKSYRTMGKK